VNRNAILTACGTFVIGVLAGVLVMTNDGAHGAINQALYGGTSNAVGGADQRSGTVTLEFSNLPWAVTNEDLAMKVREYTEAILSARIAVDRETGRSRGFGYVEVPANAAQKVIQALNGSEWGGRNLTVKEAERRTSSNPRLR
jgi:hypothetical protein